MPLGTADSFAVLAGTPNITDIPTSTITGDVGLIPGTGSGITGLTCAEVTGTIYATDATGLPCFVVNPGLLTTAKTDLITAYNDAAGRTPTPRFVSGDNQLGGQTLVPGVYSFGHATIANLIGNLTLSGDANAVWIFQAAPDLVTASASTVTLTGGAQACNVFWQVGQLRDAQHQLYLPGNHPRVDQHHGRARRDGRRPRAGPERHRHARHQHDHQIDLRAAAADPGSPALLRPVRQGVRPGHGRGRAAAIQHARTRPGLHRSRDGLGILHLPGDGAYSDDADHHDAHPDNADTNDTYTDDAHTDQTEAGHTSGAAYAAGHPGRFISERGQERLRPHRLNVGSTTLATLALVALTATGAASAGRATAAVRPTQQLVALLRPHEAWSGPAVRTVPLALVPATTPITGERTTLPVLRVKRRWLEVRLPGRPNGHTGWIRRVATARSVTHWHIVVSPTRRQVTVYRDGRRVRVFSASSASRPPRRRPASSSSRRRSRCGPPTSARRSRSR